MEKVATEACCNGPHSNTYQDGSCRFDRSGVAITCSGYSDLTPRGDESVLQWYVANVGPMSVAVDADDHFQHYGSGGLSLTPPVLFIADLYKGIY